MRIYVDSMVWIYFLEGHPQFGIPATKVIGDIRAGRHTLLTSHFVLGEILVLPVSRNDTFTIATYRRALSASEKIELVPYSSDAALRFATLRAGKGVASPDAIHLALAGSASADIFLTCDVRLHKLKVSGIGRICDLNVVLS